MITAGVIAEFNPFHDGHRELIRRIRQEVQPDQIVVVLSCWFSSRGLPSLIRPEIKTRLALEAGADLVIALPAVYTMQSADYFALYAIEALKCAGVNLLCFGSEGADLKRLEEQSAKLETLTINPSTSAARSAAKNDLALRPNDILGAQYIRCARMFGITCRLFERNQSLKSATAIRRDFFEGLEQKDDHLYSLKQSWESYYPYLRMQLLLSDPNTLRSYFLVEEGIEHRLIASARNHADFEGFLKDAISKTYTKARIQRTCMMILLRVDKTEMKKHAFFFEVMVLGMNPTGRALLASLPKGAPTSSRIRDLSDWLRRNLEKEMTLYSLIEKKPIRWQVVYTDALSDDASLA